MRILLDECVNQRLRNYLPGHEVQSARFAAFGGLKNGELLQAAEAAGFEVVLTVDRGFQYEQNLAGRTVAVIIFSTRSIAQRFASPRAGLSWSTTYNKTRRDRKTPLSVGLMKQCGLVRD